MDNTDEKLLIALWKILEDDYENICANDLRQPGIKCEIEEIFIDIQKILGPEKLQRLLEDAKNRLRQKEQRVF